MTLSEVIAYLGLPDNCIDEIDVQAQLSYMKRNEFAVGFDYGCIQLLFSGHLDELEHLKIQMWMEHIVPDVLNTGWLEAAKMLYLEEFRSIAKSNGIEIVELKRGFEEVVFLWIPKSQVEINFEKSGERFTLVVLAYGIIPEELAKQRAKEPPF